MPSRRPAVVLLLALAACASQPTVPTLAQLRGSWHLAGAAVPAGTRIPSVRFDETGEMSGNAGVNQFRGTVDAQALQKGRWEAGAVSATRMAGPPEAMAFETTFLQALVDADEALLHDGQLELRRGGQVLLRLEKLRLR
jgi:heat shock protein HslJ